MFWRKNVSPEDKEVVLDVLKSKHIFGVTFCLCRQKVFLGQNILTSKKFFDVKKDLTSTNYFLTTERSPKLAADSATALAAQLDTKFSANKYIYCIFCTRQQLQTQYDNI